MKNFFIFPLLIFTTMGIGFRNTNFTTQNNQTVDSLYQNSIITDYNMSYYNSGIITDTDGDYLGDTLYNWGRNSSGQIGNGEMSDSVYVNSPTIISPTSGDWGGSLIQLESGTRDSALSVDTDLDGYADTLYVWGDNSYNLVLNSNDADVLTPTIVLPPGQDNWGGNIIDFYILSTSIGVLIDSDLDGSADTLYTWGNNNKGQLGNGTTTSSSEPLKIIPADQDNWGGNIIDITAEDSSYSVFLSLDSDLDGSADTMYVWGGNDQGKLGIGSTSTSYIKVPTIITPGDKSSWNGDIIGVSSDSVHSMISIDTDSDGYADTIYSAGGDYEGELGNGGQSASVWNYFYASDKTWGDSNIIGISAGSKWSTMLIDSDNNGYADSFWGCGYNTYGALGTNKYTGSQKGPKVFTETFNAKSISSYFSYNFIKIETSDNSTGILVDTNQDHYGDTIFMAGKNSYGIFGIGDSYEGVNYYNPITVASSYDLLIEDFSFDFDGVLLSIDLKLNDYQNIFSEDNLPIILLTDSDNNNHTTTFVDNLSDVANDQYHYQVEDVEGAKNYTFEQISVNDNIFALKGEQFFTSYLISDYQVSNISEQKVSIDLNFTNNSDQFNLLDYSENERKIKVNYTNLDQDISNSKEFVVDENYEIILNNLNAETNYQIDSINYFYEEGNYKYTVNQEATEFKTTAAIPSLDADSIKIINNSIYLTSFQYTISIDNLKLNQDSSNFTQYDVNNGIWLVDQDGVFYNSTYIKAKIIDTGTINGTGKYELTFLQDELIENTTYNFVGISLEEPQDSSDPNIKTFSNIFSITTTAANKMIIPSSFTPIDGSIGQESFQYTIEINNLFLIDESKFLNNNLEAEVSFSNFDLDEGIYLIDENGNSYKSNYVNDSSIYLGIGEEEGTSDYQFTFKVNNLEANSKYNFVGISFTDIAEDSFSFDDPISITTKVNNTEKIIIWVIIIILVIILLFIGILLFIDLKMKKNTKEMNNKLDKPEEFKK